MKIKFNEPWVSANAEKYIGMALRESNWTGDGEFVKLAIERMSDYFGHERIILTPSGTAALELAALTLELGAGTTTRMPSYNFSSVATAFANYGSRLEFCDINPETGSAGLEELNDFDHLPDAVCYVNYAGSHQDPEAIVNFFRPRGVKIIEDNAHGFGGSFKERPYGTFGDIAALSFHGTKNLPIGEGGAAIINDEALWEKAQIVRDKGTNRAKFINGQVDKYTWLGSGGSFLMSNIVAAFLVAQLEEFWEHQTFRRELVETYHERMPLVDAAAQHFLSKKIIDGDANHIFYLVLASKQKRDNLLRFLRAHSVEASSHYVPLHDSVAGKALAVVAPEKMNSTNTFSNQMLRMPLHQNLLRSEVEVVLFRVKENLLCAEE
jgi:dTDP-4-amino-4,6-dideoxygalactose transaminase